MIKRNLLVILSLLLSLPFSNIVYAGGDPSSAKLKVYGAWLSVKGDCSDPIEILNSPEGKTIDMLQSPTLAEKDVPVATYQCLIVKMSDVIRFIPEATDGHCVAGDESKIDVCRSDFDGFSEDALTGDTLSCTTSTTVADKVFVYISTDSGCEGSEGGECEAFNAFAPPAKKGDINGIKLQNEIVVDGNTEGFFVFNLDGKIVDDDDRCDMQPPAMSYR